MAESHEDKKAKLRRRTTEVPASVQEYMVPSDPEPVKPTKKKKDGISENLTIMQRLMDLPKWIYLAIAGFAALIVFFVVILPNIINPPEPRVVYPEVDTKLPVVTKVPVVETTPETEVLDTIQPLDPNQEDVVTVTVQSPPEGMPYIEGITVQTDPNQPEADEKIDVSDTDLQIVIVPPEWAAHISDEEINATVSVNGFADGQRLSDGSIRYIIGLKEYNQKRIELNTKMEDKIVSYQLNSSDTAVKQILVGNDKQSFSIHMQKMDDEKARAAAVDVLTLAKEYGLYATKSGVTPYADIYDPDGNLVRSFRVNKDGNILTFEPDVSGLMMPVQ